MRGSRVFWTTCLVSSMLLAGCGAQADPFFEATTSDGRVRFFLTEEAARTAFDRFCSTNPAPRCDAFENYRIEATIDRLIGLNFVHRDPDRLVDDTSPVQRAFGCLQAGQRMECQSGDHRY